MALKKFLVLGIGAAQADLLSALEWHYERHACSNSDQGPGRALADKFVRIDIADTQRVLAYCAAQSIDMVYSVGSDVAMPTACWISEQLGLPRLVSFTSAEQCHNKATMRSELEGTYGYVPHQTVSHVDETVRLRYPLVVKPADSQGQRGVAIVKTSEEYRTHFSVAMAYSKVGKVVVEEVITGPEISVHAFLSNGSICWSLASDRITWPHHTGGLIHKHRIPCHLNNGAVGKLSRLIGTVTRRLAIEQGPVYFQIKMMGEEPRLIEVTPRLDGCHMWRLIKFATGDDLLTSTIGALEGKAPSLPDRSTVHGTWTLEFFCAPPDSVHDPDNFTLKPDAVYSEWYYNQGQIVRHVNGYMEKCGYQIYRS